MISYGRQTIDSSDIKSVIKVLESDYLTQGPVITQFENEVKRSVNSEHAVAVNSGTSALHLACLALGVTAGDCVWTSAISFVASANCARYCGSDVDFVDVNVNTGNLDLTILKEKLNLAKKNNSLPKTLVVVHLAGNLVDMPSIKKLSLEYKFSVIEDASHALGSTYSCGKKVGCTAYSDFTVFSFHPVKMITTAEGGMVLCNDHHSASKIRSLASHGINKDVKGNPWLYEQTELGYNYRMSDMQAALGVSQLKKLDGFVSRRREIAALYLANIRVNDVDMMSYDQFGACCHHLFQIRTENQLPLYEQLKSAGFLCQVHYIPIPSQPYYRDMGFSMADFPNSDIFYKKTISIPIYPLLSDEDVKKIIEVINDRSNR
jgi:UDP-4-amino-4,6-dideoxy-N-acetyl-beta-L-altrosamine transaminase